MGPDSTGRFRVGDAYPSDLPRGRGRLHPETMDAVGLDPGYPVAVVHDRGTVGAYVYPATDPRWPAGLVELDTIDIALGSYLRGRGTDRSGHRVTVRR